MKRSGSESLGFTLVEVMLTTVLAAVLLVALWSLLSMYSKAFEGGHARTEQSQLARALLEQISTDVQSVLIAPPETLPDRAGGAALKRASGAVTVSASTTLAAGNAPIDVVTPIAAPPFENVAASVTSTPNMPSDHQGITTASLRPAGIYGTNSYLQLDLLQPALLPPALDEEERNAGDPETPSRADELRTIVYAFEEYRDPSNPSAVSETRLVRRELSWAQAHPAHGTETGINESLPASVADGESLALRGSTLEPANPPDPTTERAAPATTPDDEQTSVAETSVPEVLAFGVRYFDGSLWSEEWDSASRRSLPVAIEVSLRLRSAEEPIDPAAVESQVQSGADLDKVESLKHPTRRLLIPIVLAPRPAATSGLLGATPPGGARGLLDTEAPRGLDSP
jgi:type II secretory pathway pseudopilin PulG